MPKPPRPAASEVLWHNLLILVGLPSLIPHGAVGKEGEREGWRRVGGQ